MKTFFAHLRKNMVDDPVAATFMLLAAICFGFGLGWGAYQNWLKPTPPPCPEEVSPAQKEWVQGLVDTEVETEAGVRTVLTAMHPGESCRLPDTIFKVWSENNNSAPIDATLLISKETSEVTEELYLPAETPVWCTPDAETSGKPYIHLVRGPRDKKPWFQIRGAETAIGYTAFSWNNFPPQRQERMVEVDIR